MSEQDRSPVECNGRSYHWAALPTVVVCIDGSEPGYIEAAITAGVAPTFARFMAQGTSLVADCGIPSFTNPNNLSIVTGVPPSVHGISGNYFYDAEAGGEVMMNDPRFLRAPTIPAAFHAAGARVAMVTAKDKLRALLAHGLDFSSGRAIALSSERADRATRLENGVGGVLALVGRPLPDVYSADLSDFVMATGVALMQSFRPDLMYLSTTDYVQHKTGPGTPLANAFYSMLDRHLAALDRLGCIIVATSDHGMNDKHDPVTLAPNVVYLEPLLSPLFPTGGMRVVLPITDPYVVHHGALGGFAMVHVAPGTDIRPAMALLATTPGVDLVLDRSTAAKRFELPPDRLGDIVVTSTRHMTLGTAPAKHDLSGLTEPLRSHGGLTEQRVSILSNHRLATPPTGLRNRDAFHLALNCVAAT